MILTCISMLIRGNFDLLKHGACRRSNPLNYSKNQTSYLPFLIITFKGCGMGPWLVLVSPCFRENLVATCKIGSFLYSLDNLLQKNVIVLFFGNLKWRSFEKRAIFNLLFTFSSHKGKVTKIPSAHWMNGWRFIMR